jgi:hypothetical protein
MISLRLSWNKEVPREFGHRRFKANAGMHLAFVRELVLFHLNPFAGSTETDKDTRVHGVRFG